MRNIEIQARNHYRAWAHQDAGEITYQLAREPLTKTARRLGRTLHATYKYMRRTQPVNIQSLARRHAGMSHQDVATALGVDQQRVSVWVQVGWLARETSYGLRASYPTYDPLVVSAFLRERGALLPYLRPSGVWTDEVALARASLHARYISRADLARLLLVTNGCVTYWRARKGFPDAALRFGRQTATYYERAAVRAWLDAHSRHWTADAREAL